MGPLPGDIANEWVRFLDTRPTTDDQVDWITLKAAEHGWNFFDLSLALSTGVRRVELRDADVETVN